MMRYVRNVERRMKKKWSFPITYRQTSRERNHHASRETANQRKEGNMYNI